MERKRSRDRLRYQAKAKEIIARNVERRRRQRERDPYGARLKEALFRAGHPFYEQARRLGIIRQEIIAMAEAQKHLCAICRKPSSRINRFTGKPMRLAIDHCNRALGLFEDNPALLRAAADYIEGRRI